MFLVDLVQLRRERGAPPHAEEGVDPGRELRRAAEVDASTACTRLTDRSHAGDRMIQKEEFDDFVKELIGV